MNSNVDKDEVEKFAVLAARWWDKNSEFKPLHDINPLRLNYIKEQCGGSLQGKRILDIGCGGGILSESLALEGATVVGIDLAEAGLEVAKLHLLESGLDIDYKFISAEELVESEQESFDVIACLEMLEHVPDPSLVIEACSKLVKSNGRVFFSTINRNPKSYFFAIVGAEYVLRWLPIGTHEWEKFVKPEKLNEMAKNHYLELENLDGMKFNLLTDKWSLSSDKSINYIAQFKKI